MVEYTLLEKIKVVFDLILASPLFLVLLLGVLLMVVDTLYISKQDAKTKKIYIGASLLVVILFMYSYLDSLTSILDTIAKNMVTIIYFPTVLEYIATLIVSIIILGFSIFSSKMKPLVKRINILCFAINSFIFFLILDQIASSEVDLTNKVSIYTNSNLMALLELSLVVFVIWIIGLTLYKITKLITPKAEKQEEINLDTTMNFYDEPVLPANFTDLRNKELIPEPKVEYVVIKAKNESDMFTLEEYKQMRELLEVIKNQNKQERGDYLNK